MCHFITALILLIIPISFYYYPLFTAGASLTSGQYNTFLVYYILLLPEYDSRHEDDDRWFQIGSCRDCAAA